MKRLLAVVAAAAATAAPASASIWIADGARSPSLRVDSRGNAEVRWRDARGVAHTLLVPSSGSVLPGGHLAGPDVSRRVGSSLALAVVTRQTPDGRQWALQRWQVLPNGPVELHLARWTGDPTSVTAQVENDHLVGSAEYHGKAVYGTSPTTAGKRLRVVAYVDAARGGTWRRLLGVFPRGPDGSFGVFLRPAWAAPSYRVTLYGPNLGWAFTPDARTVVTVP